MRLGNDLCAVEICNDTRYTLNSADNPHYDLELNPLNFKKNDFYQTIPSMWKCLTVNTKSQTNWISHLLEKIPSAVLTVRFWRILC